MNFECFTIGLMSPVGQLLPFSLRRRHAPLSFPKLTVKTDMLDW